MGIVLTMLIVAASCSGRSLPPADVQLVFDREIPDWFPRSTLLAGVEPTSTEVLGVANWDGGQHVVLSYSTEFVSECWAVVSASSSTSLCSDDVPGRSVLLDLDIGLGDDGPDAGKYIRALLRLESRVTEVRVITADGTVYASEPLGKVGFIEWVNVAGNLILELYGGTSLVHREAL